jgi:hypothetical protein
MNELSLHILDICENSIKANAKNVTLIIEENTSSNTFIIKIIDDGEGMNEETLKKVTDPFYTTRTTRKVGLGISLFKMAAELTGGFLNIDSQLGKGTTVEVLFHNNHIDRAPLGDISDTIITLISRGNFDLNYTHKIDEESFNFNTKDIKEFLGQDNLDDPSIILWIRNHIKENIIEIKKGTQL